MHCSKVNGGYSGLTTEQAGTVAERQITCEGMVAQVNSGWIMKGKMNLAKEDESHSAN